MADLSLIFDILARDNASKTFRSVGDAAEDAGRRGGSGLASITASARGLAATLAGAGVITLLKDSIGAASDLAETTNKSNVIFGQNASEVRAWAQESARSFGLSRAAALEAASGLGNMLTQLGYTGDAAVQTSTSTVQLAADLGSFNNLETGDVLDRINGALRGEYDSLQLLIPNINAARVEQEALAETGKKSADQLTAQEKAAAVLAIVQRDGAAAQNDFAETSGGLANQAKIAQAQFEDFQATLGERFLPAATGALTFLNDYGIPVLGGVADTAGVVVDVVGGVVGVVTAIPGPVLAAVGAMTAFALLKGPVSSAMDTIALRSLYAKDAITGAAGGLGGFRGAANGVVGVLGGPFGIAVGAGAAAVALIASEISDASAQTDSWAQSLLAGGAAAQEAMQQAADERGKYGDGAIGDLSYNIDQFFGLASSMEEAQAQARQLYDALDPIAQAQQNVTHDTNELADAIDRYGENSPQAQAAAEALARSNERLAERQEAVTRATEAATAANDPAAAAAQTLADAQAELADQTSAAKQQVDAIRLALEQLGGGTVNTLELEAALGAAVADAAGKMDGLAGSVLNAAGGLDTNSEAGRAAIDVLGGIRGAGFDLIANQAQLGESTGDLTGRAVNLRNQFIQAAGQMGINSAEANRLADQYGLIPEQVVTDVQANAGSARATIADVQAMLNALDGRTVSVKVLGQAATGAISSAFGFPARADGGPVAAGRTYLVGEEGPELVQFGASGFVTPADRTADVLATQRTLAPGYEGLAGGLGGPKTVIHDNRQVYAQVDARALSAQMTADQRELEHLHG